MVLVLPLPAFAEFVDRFGNPVVPTESYQQMPGGAAWRDTNGQIHYEYVRPSPSDNAPVLAPSMHSQPWRDRYDLLHDVTPGSSYRSDSIFSDRVTPPMQGR